MAIMVIEKAQKEQERYIIGKEKKEGKKEKIIV